MFRHQYPLCVPPSSRAACFVEAVLRPRYISLVAVGLGRSHSFSLLVFRLFRGHGKRRRRSEKKKKKEIAEQHATRIEYKMGISNSALGHRGRVRPARGCFEADHTSSLSHASSPPSRRKRNLVPKFLQKHEILLRLQKLVKRYGNLSRLNA